jgi:calcium-dependent protein kinase
MGSICCAKGQPLYAEGNFHSKSLSTISVGRQRLFRNFNSFDSSYSLAKNKLGYGSYGDVKLCTDKKLKVSKAVKIINKDYLRTANIENSWFYNKIDILNRLDHPLIISFYEFFEERDFFYLLMDYHEEGDLLNHLKNKRIFKETSICIIIQQLLIVICYMHKQKIAHRDIKPENILLSTERGISIKLIDFDTAASFEEKGLSGAHGTFHYMAPETVNRSYNEKCDVWSCGIIMYVLLTGKKNLPGLTDKQDPKKLQMIKFDFSSPVWAKFSQNAVDLIKLMLQKDPVKRISAEDSLKHSWFERLNLMNYEACFHVLVRIRNSEVSTFVKSAKKFLIQLKSSADDLIEIEKVFIHLDTDFDGLLVKEDFFRFFCIKHSRNESSAAAEEIIEKFRNTEVVCYSDFVEVAINSKHFLENNNLQFFFEFLSSGCEKIRVEQIIERLSWIKAWDKDDVDCWSKYFLSFNKDMIGFDDFFEIVCKALRVSENNLN